MGKAGGEGDDEGDEDCGRSAGASLLESAVGVGLFAVVLGMYSSTAYPSVAGGDSGELITAAFRGGVAHPPGYPLYTMLASAAIQSLEGTGLDVAGRANQLSCLLGAAAASLLYFSLLTWFSDSTESDALSKPRGSAASWFCAEGTPVQVRRGQGGMRAACALLVAGMFATNSTVWDASTHAEVFALNNALCSLLLLCVSKSSRQRRDDASRGWLQLGALVTGLCMSNQHTSLLLILPSVAAVIHHRGLSCVPALIPYALIGLIPHAYLPFGAFTHPEASWGGEGCSTGWGFLRHITRRDYGTLQLTSGDASGGSGWRGHATRVWILAYDFAGETYHLGLVSLVWGVREVMMGCAAGGSLVKRGGVGFAAVGCILLHVVLFLGLANVDSEDALSRYVLSRFSPQVLICCYSIAGAGLLRCLTSIKAALLAEQDASRSAQHPAKKGTRQATVAPGAASGVDGISLIVLSAVIFGCVASSRMDAADQSANRIVRKYAEDVLSATPENGILVTQGDAVMYGTRYLQQVEGVRSDVTLIEADMVSGEWYRRLFIPGWLHKERKRPSTSQVMSLGRILKGAASAAARGGAGFGGIYAAPDIKGANLGMEHAGLQVVSWGLLKRVIARNEPGVDVGGGRGSYCAIDVVGTPLEPYLWREGWERAVLSYHWHAQLSAGFTSMKAASLVLHNDSSPQAERDDAASRLLVAIEGMEGVRRRFGGYNFNCDLPRNLGFSYALLAHISRQARGGDGLSQVPRPQLLRARDSALSAYVNCRGAQPAVVQAANSILMGKVSNIKMHFP